MKILFIVPIMLFSLSAVAQTRINSISGQIRDIQNEPVGGAIIKLQRTDDSIVLKTVTSKENGKFIITTVDKGTFFLSITSVGSKRYTSNILEIDSTHASVALPIFILTPEKQAKLKEVAVIIKKPLLEQDIDRTIVNVEAMISSATGNALEVLERTPGITIQDGDINLNGRSGVVVLIEGRPTYMSSGDLLAYLRSIPGSTLDKIELMENPPARYDAAGNAVINIRFKKNRIQGYTANISSAFLQGITHSNYNSLHLNYLNKKVNLFGNLSINKDKNFDDDTYDRIFYNSNSEKISSAKLRNYYRYDLHDITIRTGMDYSLSSKTTVGVITSYYNRDRREEMNSHNNIFYNDPFIPDSSGYGILKGNSRWKQITANINLLHKFNTSGRELSAELNFMNYNNGGRRLFNNFTAMPNGADSSYVFQYDLPSGINIYTFNADYTHPFRNKIIFSAGIKSSLVKNDNASYYSDIVNNTHKQDLSKSNHFIYTENINAAYVNARKEWKRLGVQTGIRTENTNTKGNQLGNAAIPRSVHTNHYTGIFTSLFLNYKIDSTGKNVLSLNISRRINRPNYQQLNPFIIFIDQYSYSSGNPYLSPAYNHSLELNYRYKQFARISFQYNRINDAFFNATRTANNIFITRPENADTRYMMAIMTNLNFSVAAWWRLNVDIGGANFVTKGNVYDQNLYKSIYAYRVNTLSQFIFKKGWSAEIVSRYTSSIIQLQRIYKPRYQINAGIQKRMLKNKASVKLNVDDIFYTLKQKDITTGLSMTEAYHLNIEDTRRIRIGLSYNFGKEGFSRKRRNNSDGIDEEKGRVE